MLPSSCYDEITMEDLQVLEENLKAIKENDLFLIPDAFYDKADSQEITALEYLYEREQNDVNTYLLDIISKEASTDNTYETVNKENCIGYVAFLNDLIEPEKEKICVYSSKDEIYKVRRYYIMQTESYDEYLS